MSETPRIQLEGPVVIVDDDEAFRRELREALEALGQSVIALESASHAVRFLQNQPWNWRPGLICTDLVMDGMGGYQLLRRMPEIYPNRNIPLLVISRLSSGLDVGEAEVAGASGYLTKPLKTESLEDILRKITDKEKKGIVVFTHDVGAKVFQR